MLTRRSLLQTSAAACLLGGLPRVRAESTSSKKGPRYFVNIFLRGGIDAVYTTDPKTKHEVDDRVDVPYDIGGIVDGGKLQFGPHFRPLAKYADKIAILRGVQVSTANHETGGYQATRLRTNVQPGMPSLQDILGMTRDDQPLGSVAIGHLAVFEHSPGGVVAPTGDPSEATTSLDAVDEISDEEAGMLASSFKQHLKSLPSHLSGREEITRDHLQQAQAFFAKLKSTPRFKNEDWDTRDSDAKRAGKDLQRTLWFLKHDMARAVFCKIQLDWDSHFRNADKQTLATSQFVNVFEHFIDALHETKNEHGTLAEQTVVVLGSELGRFPIINGNLGKDHFPEIQMMLMGPGIATGNAFVPTGKMMEGQKVDFKTGKADDNGQYVFLDDVGTTLLSMAGMKPELYGYAGRRLQFLERA
jgi:hypothetical protein